MNGSKIIMSSEPRGIFLEGTVSGTPYPGTCMQVVAATAPVGGDFTWAVYNPAADGDPRLVVVLLESDLQGQIYSTQYVSGTRAFLYCPYGGEFMNMLVAAQQGTGSANVHTIGDRFIIVHGTGLLTVEATSSVVAPFTCMETITLAADVQGWVWCMRS